MNRNLNRRSMMSRIGAFLGASFLFRNSYAATPKTPNAIEGPYYPRRSMRHADTDNDLVKIEGAVKEAGGEVIYLKGNIRGTNGQPISGLRIEIWQCDVNGKYLHPRDRQSVKHDPAFQGFGHDITGENGEYSFRTIKPTRYPGRVEHIHVKILSERGELLTTQLYLDGQMGTETDWIYSRLSPEEASTVSMKFAENNAYPEAVINFVV